MSITRRKFLGDAATLTTGLALSSKAFSWSAPARSLAALAEPLLEPADGETLITILHTNDMHSQIDPLPANDRYAGKGGIARRATLVKRIRKENPNTLLLDAGDCFQGTPYFNLYKGVVEYKAMSAVGYDVVTLGNHDFDNGIDALAETMKSATFESVSPNSAVMWSAIPKRAKAHVARAV